MTGIQHRPRSHNLQAVRSAAEQSDGLDTEFRVQSLFDLKTANRLNWPYSRVNCSPPFPCLTVVGRERGAGTSSTQIVVRARE